MAAAGQRTATAASPQPTTSSAAANYASVAFPADPLSVQVIPLRRPEGFAPPSGGPALQCTEPGDLLHEAIAGSTSTGASAPSSQPAIDISTAVALPALTYPRSDASAPRYLCGEMYRGTLVIHNQTSFEVQHVSARAEVVDVRNARRVVADVASQTLGPFATLERRLDPYEWVAAGRHSVKVLVHYTDPSRAGEVRNVESTVPITVAMGPRVVEMDVTPVPAFRAPIAATALQRRGAAAAGGGSVEDLTASATSGPSSAAGGGAGGSSGDITVPGFDEVLAARYRCSVVIANVTTTPIHLTEIVFRKTATTHETLTVRDPFDTKGSVARDGLWLPEETRRFVFEVSAAPAQTAALAVAGATGQDAKASAAATELGVMRWAWRRPNGDGGHGATPRPFVRPALVPLVSSMLPTAPTASRTAVSTMQLHAPYVVVRACATEAAPAVGEAVVLRFAVANLTSRPIDAIATVGADRLLPQVLFAGAVSVAVGTIEPKGVGILSLKVVPLIAGRVTIDASCFEIRDRLRSADPSLPPLWPNDSCDLRGNLARDLVVGEYLVAQAGASDVV